MRILRIYRVVLPALALLLSGCNILMPRTENARQDAQYKTVATAHAAFDSIVADKNGTATTESYLRNMMKLGPPYTAERTVGPSRIAAVLTNNIGDGALQMLDVEIQACIKLANASDACKMIVFSDAYDHKRGLGQNVLARALGIYERTETVSWSYEMFLVMQLQGEGGEKEFRVIHKQFESVEDPSKIKKNILRSLDNVSVDISP